MMRRILLALVFLGLLASQAVAHKVNVFAVVENGFVTGEGYFSTGAKAQKSTVEIRNAKGDMVAQGLTKEDGTFRIALPPGAGAPLTVRLKAGEGHQSDFTLTGEDLGQTGPGQACSPAATSAPARAGTDTPPSLSPPAQVSGVAASTVFPAAAAAPAQASGGPAGAVLPVLDEARISALMEAAAAKAVEEKTAPIRLELAKLVDQEQGMQLRGIVGGLGWIIGLVGIAAWFKRPRK